MAKPIFIFYGGRSFVPVRTGIHILIVRLRQDQYRTERGNGTIKEKMRRKAKEVRAALSREEVVEHSRKIEGHLRGLIDGDGPVMVYASKPGEVDTSGLIAWLLVRGVRVVVPIIERETRSLRLSYLVDPADLRSSTFSVPEPIGREIPADQSSIGLVIVPLIAFDSRGCRIGYGAGYYDRFLSKNPHMRKIGVAFSCQQVDVVPVDENDISLDAIVTEKGVMWIGERRG